MNAWRSPAHHPNSATSTSVWSPWHTGACIIICIIVYVSINLTPSCTSIPASQPPHALDTWFAETDAAAAPTNTEDATRTIAAAVEQATSPTMPDTDGGESRPNSSELSDRVVDPDHAHHLHRESVKVQDMLPFATTPGDSTGVMFTIRRESNDIQADEFHYELCSFTNVCATSDGLYLYVQSEAEYDRLTTILEECSSPAKRFEVPRGMFGPCHCFYPQFQLRMLPYYDGKKDGKQSPHATKDAKEGDETLPSQRWRIESDPLANINRGHYFGIHKYVRIHHIAHWSQKILLFQSALTHFHSLLSLSPTSTPISSFDPVTGVEVSPPGLWSPSSSYPLEPFSGMVLHDLDLPLTDHESGIFNRSLEAIIRHGRKEGIEHEGLSGYLEGHHLSERSREHRINGNMIFAGELEKSMKQARTYWEAANHTPSTSSASPASSIPPSTPQCYERLTFTRAFGIFSTSALDTNDFREASYRYHNLTTLKSRCPPRRIVLLYRSNRMIMNWEELRDMVHEMTGGRTLERVTIDARSTHAEQVELFATTGMMISSHSSQLVNVMFSHPHSTMIEVTPEFYNADFSEYAHGMGVFFQYAIGGTVVDGTPEAAIDACTAALSVCEGDSQCILRERYKCGRRSYTNKNHNFHADLNAVRQAIKHAIQHLNWVCGGKW